MFDIYALNITNIPSRRQWVNTWNFPWEHLHFYTTPRGGLFREVPLDTCIWDVSSECPGPWFNIKMSSYQYRKSRCGDKTVVRSSYLHNGVSYPGKIASLYWFSPLEVLCLEICQHPTENLHSIEGNFKHPTNSLTAVPRTKCIIAAVQTPNKTVLKVLI